MAFFPTDGGGGLFKQGAFQIDPNATPEQIQRKREQLAALMDQYGNAKYVGQGLGHLATGILQGRQNRQLDKAEGVQRSKISEAFGRLFNGGGTATDGAPILGPTPYTPPDPNSPEGIAADTMAALGKTPDYSGLEQQYGLPSGYLTRTRQLESGGNPNAQNPNSSAGGDFQFIDSTAQAYGLTNKNDPFASADAAARLARDNKAYLTKALGREPTAAELYLAHQQGAGGAAKLILNPTAMASGAVGNDAVTLNGGNANMNAGQFANQWLNKFNGTAQPMPASGGPDIATLAQIAASPYADPGQKAVAQAMLEQQLGAMDPNNQLDLEYKRAQIAALKNPAKKDDRTSAQKEYGQAVQEYILRNQPVPTFTEWERGNKASGATTVNVGDGSGARMGTIPQGYTAIEDPTSPAGYRMVAIPGGPEDTSKADEKKAENAATASDIVTNAARLARTAAENRDFGPAGTSLIAGLPIIGAQTDSGEVMRQVDVLKSQAKVTNLQAMRDASPTGGALGAVSAPELKMLEDQAGALDPNSPTFARDLDNYERTLLRVIHGKEAGDRIFEQTRGDSEGWQTVNGVKIRVKQ